MPQWLCISVPETTRTWGSFAEVAEETEDVELTLWVFRGGIITRVCVRVGSAAALRKSVKGRGCVSDGAAIPAYEIKSVKLWASNNRQTLS